MNKTGQYISRKAAPADLLTRKVPHLAFFDEAYYDSVIAKVRARNAHFRSSDDPAADPCLNRSRKESRCPGKITVCGICNRLFIWGGNGQPDHLLCRGATCRRCWVGATFDGRLAAGKIAAAVMGEVEQLAGFDPVFLQTVTEEGRLLDEENAKAIKRLNSELAVSRTAIANVMAFVRAGKAMDSTHEELARLELEKDCVAAALSEKERAPVHTVEIPPVDEIKGTVRSRLCDLAASSVEFAKVMRKLVPRIVVFPYRLCDGGPVVLRAKFRLQLANLLSDKAAADVLRRPLERIIEVDLFERPQRAKFREQIVTARAAGKNEREAATLCGITITAAGWAERRERVRAWVGAW